MWLRNSVKFPIYLFIVLALLSLAWYMFGYMVIGDKAVFNNVPGYKIVKSLETQIYHVSEKSDITVIWYSKNGILEQIKEY